MRNCFLFIIAFLALGCAGKRNPALQNTYYLHAQKLIDDKDFFTARDYVAANKDKFSKFHTNLLNAGLKNAFNRPEESNAGIGILLRDFKSQLSDSAMLELLRLKQANHARLFEYKEAGAVTDEILNKYSSILDRNDIDDYKNTGSIWHILSDTPKQEVIIDGYTTIQMSRDKAGLANLEISTVNTKTAFIFDTGANISTVTRSTAGKLAMKMLGGSIEVGTITGEKVNAELAVCPEFRMGNIRVKNAVFLVFPDQALAFPQIDYQINGILGFPVIEELKEIQITQKDEFIVPKVRTVNHEQNMALDFLNPVININGEYYTFDSGATGTSLYAKYLNRHRDEVTGHYEETDIEFGGAGGMTKVRGYKIIFNPVINGKELRIEDVQLYTGNTGNDKQSKYYGNVGQDIIRQFDKMTLNFESMFIKFD